MKVSVIIPIYNTAEYLEKCISSILKQTYTNFELILINDGSPDHSEEIINEFLKKKDARIVYRKFKNGGLSFARNRGLDLVSGDYVVFVDSDDWVDPDFIQDFINNMSNHKRLVVQDLKEVYTYKTVRNVQGYKNELFSIPADFLSFINNYRFTQGYAWNKFYNLSVIRHNNIHFKEGKVMNEDELFYMEYIKYIDEIYFIPKDNYNYFQRNNSITSTLFTFPAAKVYLEGLILFLNYLASIKKDSPEIKVYVENRLNHIFDYVLRSCIYGHNYTWKTRIEYINELYYIILPFMHVLRPKTQLQKIDLKLFMKKQFWILDFVIFIKTKLN